MAAWTGVEHLPSAPSLFGVKQTSAAAWRRRIPDAWPGGKRAAARARFMPSRFHPPRCHPASFLPFSLVSPHWTCPTTICICLVLDHKVRQALRRIRFSLRFDKRRSRRASARRCLPCCGMHTCATLFSPVATSSRRVVSFLVPSSSCGRALRRCRTFPPLPLAPNLHYLPS